MSFVDRKKQILICVFKLSEPQKKLWYFVIINPNSGEFREVFKLSLFDSLK